MPDYVSHPVVQLLLLFVVQIALFGFLETRWRARRIDWRKVLLFDLMAVLFCVVVVRKVSNYVNAWTMVQGPWPAAIATWPLPARLVLYLLVADFGAYWMHRLVHLAPLWRVHRWHHSPSHMYWLAGSRASILQQVLFNLPYIFASPLLGVSPLWLGTALMVLYSTTNGWMHMNVNWRLRGLDWVLATPRSHHIHHSDNPAHYNSNFGVLFSVWDRMFGTFTSPHDVDPQTMRFGIGEKVPAARLAVGI